MKPITVRLRTYPLTMGTLAYHRQVLLGEAAHLDVEIYQALPKWLRQPTKKVSQWVAWVLCKAWYEEEE